MEKEMKKIKEMENIQIQKWKDIVDKSIQEEKSILENVLKSHANSLTYSQKISDTLARFGGSWKFIISFFIILLSWIVINSTMSKSLIFDPFPFILMNLILSCLAAIQAPLIMMSQNRQEEKDRKRNENDYLVNLKAEMEIRALHEKVDVLLQEQIKLLFEIQNKQMEMLNKIEAKLS